MKGIHVMIIGGVIALATLDISAATDSDESVSNDAVVSTVPQAHQQEVVRRNELAYEDRVFHAVSHHHQIVQFDVQSLEKPGVIVELKLLPNLAPIQIRSYGIDRKNDRQAIWEGTIVRARGFDTVDSATRDIIDRVSLNITTWIYNGDLDEYFEPPAAFDESEIIDWTPGTPVLAPFPIGPNTRVVYSVRGDLNIYVDDVGMASYQIRPFERDKGYSLIIEVDQSKRWEIGDVPIDANSDAGRRYSAYEKARARHMDAVKRRIELRTEN